MLRAETTLRGSGRFDGTVSGEGDNYKVMGQLTSDALAADGVRLQALNVNATGTGSGKTYEVQGKAVAELLTAGDYRINGVQLAGGVRGTGTDFRWLGDLRAAAVRGGQTGIGDLIVSDAVAEFKEGRLEGTAGGVSARTLTTGDTAASGVRAGGVRFNRDKGGLLRATAESASVASVKDQDTVVSDIREQHRRDRAADESADVTVGAGRWRHCRLAVPPADSTSRRPPVRLARGDRGRQRHRRRHRDTAQGGRASRALAFRVFS